MLPEYDLSVLDACSRNCIYQINEKTHQQIRDAMERIITANNKPRIIILSDEGDEFQGSYDFCFVL